MHDSLLISPEYKKLNEGLYKKYPLHYGMRGFKRGSQVWTEFIDYYGLRSERVLDYGCGKGTLAKWIKIKKERFKVVGYDPCVSSYANEPESKDFDGVVCLDMLEHVEPDLLDNVLNHIISFSDLFFFNIALCPSNKTLPDGRNAHLIIKDSLFWKAKLLEHGLINVKEIENEKTSTNPELVFYTGVWKKKEE